MEYIALMAILFASTIAVLSERSKKMALQPVKVQKKRS